MIKQALILSFAFVMLCSWGCKATKVYSDYCAPLVTDHIQKITITIHTDTIKSVSITEKQEMKEFITDMNNSKVDGPWKGANWDKIVLHYDAGEKIFSTNGEVFGQGSSGTFYDLNDKYRHYWKK